MSKTDLAVIPLFKALPPQEIERLEAVLEIRAFENGAWLFKEGDRGDSFFIIMGGQVSIIKASGRVGGFVELIHPNATAIMIA